MNECGTNHTTYIKKKKSIQVGAIIIYFFYCLKVQPNRLFSLSSVFFVEQQCF